MPLYCLQIRGRVQGVSYRYATKMQADRLGVKGMVKNEPDGSVFAEIEGEEAQLQAMIEWCRQGPPMARVEEVAVSQGAAKQYSTFEIIRS